MGWRIYYTDNVVSGETMSDWINAPADDVQVVVSFPRTQSLRWSYQRGKESVPVSDRDLWTGEDVYDPFGWGEKFGREIAWDDYIAIWERACGDD